MKGQPLTLIETAKILNLFEEGLTRKQVAKKTGIAYNTVCNYILEEYGKWHKTSHRNTPHKVVRRRKKTVTPDSLGTPSEKSRNKVDFRGIANKKRTEYVVELEDKIEYLELQLHEMCHAQIIEQSKKDEKHSQEELLRQLTALFLRHSSDNSDSLEIEREWDTCVVRLNISLLSEVGEKVHDDEQERKERVREAFASTAR